MTVRTDTRHETHRGRIADHELPSVSVLIPTYNFAPYIARSIESTLAQDYPAGKLEVIVVDDGSEDGTSEIAARYEDDITYIRKENGGVVSTLNRLIAESTGELLCIQSGDDVSFPGRLRTQASAFVGRPDLGLHYCDMALIDADDGMLHPSWFAWLPLTPERGHNLPSVLIGNLAAGGSMMLNRSFLDAFYPIPASAGVEDWWITVRVSEVAEIDYTDRALYGYRRHEANLSLGARTGEERLLRHELGLLPFRRWLATQARCPTATAAHWTRVLSELLDKAHLVAAGGHELRSILTVDDADRSAAGAAMESAVLAWARGRRTEAVRAAVAAFGYDPFDGERVAAATALLAMANAAAHDRPFAAREFVTLTLGTHLLAAPDLLDSYGTMFHTAGSASLVILVEESDIERLVKLVESCGLGGDEGPDLVAMPTAPADQRTLDACLPFANAVLSAADGRAARGARLVGETFSMSGLFELYAASLRPRP